MYNFFLLKFQLFAWLCLSFTLFFFRANLHKNWETLEKQPNTLSTTLNSVMGQDYNKYIQNKEINVLYVFETSLIFSYQQALLNLIFFYESPNFILILTIDKLSIYQQISRPLVTYVVSLPENSQFPNYIYVNFVQQRVKEKVIQTSLDFHHTYTKQWAKIEKSGNQLTFFENLRSLRSKEKVF